VITFSWRSAAAGIPLAILYLLLYFITATLVLLVWPGAREVDWGRALLVTMPIALTALLLVVRAFAVEIGSAFVVTRLGERGPGVAIAAAALLRGVFYLHQGPLAAISVVAVGLAFAALFWQRRNAWPQIVGHAIASLVTFAFNPERVV